jgi:hypothetical protein
MEVDVLRIVHGTYQGGRIELDEQPSNIGDETPAIVTFLEPGLVDLRAYGFDKIAAAELRARLTPLAKDWDSPEMDDYDNYDAIRANM